MNTKYSITAKYSWPLMAVFRGCLSILFLVSAFSFALPGAAASAGAERTVLAGKISSIRAVHVSRAAPPRKLNRVIDRHRVQVSVEGRGVTGSRDAAALDGEWSALIARLRTLPRRERVLAVDRYFAGFGYTADIDVWRQDDFWATPYEFLARRQGDCEEFAVAKYLALRAAGFDDGDLNLIGVTDRQSRRFHMVLAVDVDGETLILDNQAAAPVASLDLRRYEPAYVINQSNRWIVRRIG